MSRSFVLLGLVERLREAPPALGLVGRQTAWLALAWGVHAALAGCNPRWRVMLWRTVAVGLGAIALLHAAPPVVTWRLLPRVESPGRAPLTLAEPGDRPPAMSFDPIARPPLAVANPVAPEPEAKWITPWIGLPKSVNGLMLSVWLAGTVLLTARLAWSVRRLTRVVRHAQDAPHHVIEASRAIAVRLGVTRGVRVLQSAEVLTPCLTGSIRPVLLLPERLCREAEQTDLPAVFAHELAHVRGNDLVGNDCWHLASLLLWFHPLVWRARAVHAAACDSVCDAVAADLLGNVSSYVRTLARLALQVAGPPPALGLTMARTSDVRRRIEALERKVFSRSLSRRIVMPVLLAFGVLIILIGGLGLAPAEPVEVPRSEPPPAEARAEVKAPAKQKRMVIRVVADKTGEPLEGVSVSYSLDLDPLRRSEEIKTDRDGMTSIEWPEDAVVKLLDLEVKTSKYSSMRLHWNDRLNVVRLPEFKEVRLESGGSVGGIVRDEDGRPIAGAVVNLHQSGDSAKSGSHLSLGRFVTDAQGRWRFDEAPSDLSRLRVLVAHPGYRRGSSTDSERRQERDAASLRAIAPHYSATRRRSRERIQGREIEIVLAKGLTVRGRVVDGAGEPVKGARAVVGDGGSSLRSTTNVTDGRGEFVLNDCAPGLNAIIILAEGFAPAFREIAIAPNRETTMPEFRLERGSTLRVKVVDRAGRPIAGASFRSGLWRDWQGLGSIGNGSTDADGRFVWHHAPKDAVQYRIRCDGYQRVPSVELVASAEVYVVTLHPELVVSGRVTDAVTGQPIPRFRVLQGFEGSDEDLLSLFKETDRKLIKASGLFEAKSGQPSWPKSAVAEATEGSYSTRFDSPRQANYLRIEAPGYKPADSRPFQPDEGAQTLDFSLVRQ